MNPKYKVNIKKYFLVLIVTGMIFLIGLYAGHYFEQQKLEDINSMRADLELDILSTETQFSLLETAICENTDNTTLTQEQYEIERTLSKMGERLGNSHPQVQRLRKHYFLLEIKNFLIVKKKKKQCEAQMIPILYFRGPKEKCPKCKEQNFVLDYLKKYPFLKIYTFDYNSQLTAVKTLKSLYSIKGKLPLLVIGGKTYSGFKSKKKLIKTMPEEFEQYKKEWKKEQRKEATTTEENGEE